MTAWRGGGVALALLACMAARGRAQDAATEERLKDLEDEVDSLRSELKEVREEGRAAGSGTTKFLLTGYGFSGYTNAEGGDSTFRSGFNPIFLWKQSERLFFEAEIELELEESETEVDLEYAHVVVAAGDHVQIGAGKFLTPFGTFAERLHPAWINKLPDAPMAFGHDGLAPTASVGVQARFAAEAGAGKIVSAVYLSNGPRLNTGDDEPDEAGMLHFDNVEDVDHNKAVGGRFGWLPIPELEIGYSFKTARVDASGTDASDARALLHGADLGYQRESDALGGAFDVRAEWVWSKVDDVTYDPAGALGFGPVTFDNRRDGGYLQLAYRPSKSEQAVLKNLEFVLRYDALGFPDGAPMEVDEARWSVGVDYWWSPSTVVKLAWRIDDKEDPAGMEEDVDAVLAQIAVGF